MVTLLHLQAAMSLLRKEVVRLRSEILQPSVSHQDDLERARTVHTLDSL
jgi:hypothetical protein